MLNGIYDPSRSRRKKSTNVLFFLILPIVFSIGGVVILTILLEKAQVVVFLGMISFVLTTLISFLYIIFWILRSSLYVRKHYYGLWKNLFSFSYKTRAAASRQIGLLNDPYLRKNKSNKLVVFYFLVWAVLFTLGVFIVLYIETSSKI